MMKFKFTLILFVCLVSANVFGGEQLEKRCGWIENPTPGNWWLQDRDGEWTIGVQMGHQAEGEIPAFPGNRKFWKKTNGSYGIGCACLTVTTDRKEKKILTIQDGKALPLEKCSSDPKLKRS